MTHKNALYRTLADYRPFLHHSDPIVRSWAVHCLEEQYPDQTADSFAHLLTDDDGHLQISAASAIGQSGDTRFEPALLAVWPTTEGGVHNWFTIALGQLHSTTLLPELIATLDTLPAKSLPAPTGEPAGTTWIFPHAAAEALGYYPDQEARATLWRLLERYPADDRLTFNIVQGLWKHIRPDELPRLTQRLATLKPGASRYWRSFRALSEATNLVGLAEQLVEPLLASWEQTLDFLEFWFLDTLHFSEAFEVALQRGGANDYADILPAILTELERLATKRNDDLSSWTVQWQTGQRPAGYRWRMVLAHQLLTALVAHPPSQLEMYQEAAALGLALLGQAVVDQDDQAALEAAPNEMFRQATLLAILDSPRPNVLPDVVVQIVGLGPTVIPHLSQILESDNVWAWLRALSAIEQIARAHPGAADTVTPTILDMVHLEQSDEVLEAISAVLIAIGPGAVLSIGERLGQDYVYNIYAGSALANIPTETSVMVWLDYLAQKPALEETDWEYLVDLGHPAGIPFLRDQFEWGDDPQLCTALYKLAIVTDYSGPELAHWQAVARRDYQQYQNWRTSSKPSGGEVEVS